MPLHTRIERNGDYLSLNWGGWHVMRMQEIAITEQFGSMTSYGDDDFWSFFKYTALAKNGFYVVQEQHDFRDESDGELLTILPGDILHMTR